MAGLRKGKEASEQVKWTKRKLTGNDMDNLAGGGGDHVDSCKWFEGVWWMGRYCVLSTDVTYYFTSGDKRSRDVRWYKKIKLVVVANRIYSISWKLAMEVFWLEQLGRKYVSQDAEHTGRGDQELYFRVSKFEMSIRHPSGIV